MKKQKISILIPVYRESELLEPLLKSLIADFYQPKEVLCIIDDPTEKSLKIVDIMKDEIKFILNGHRKGKVNVLNEASKILDGDIILFLDSDVKITDNSHDFLEKIVEEMEETDLLDIKKKVLRDSFLAKITYYHYLCSNITNWLFSKRLKKCLVFNGAAFAIRRELFEKLGGFQRVVSEDLDLGIRSFLENYRFKHTEEVEVFTAVPSTWKQWYIQRKRWGIGIALWIKNYYKDLAKTTVKFPKTIIPALFIASPPLTLFLAALFFLNISYQSIFFLIASLATKIGFQLPLTLFSFVLMVLVKNLMFFFIGFGVPFIFYYFAAKKFNYMFNPIEFAIFYIILSPLWFLIIIVSLIKVLVQPQKFKIDWKC
jgi:cellulose synthase/poly-beta-1,6-N-acetylglucosamine synthase-like glycosyltransferase